MTNAATYNIRTRLIDFSEDFLSLSWEWLHEPEIKKMTDTPSFSKEDQLLWFSHLSLRTDYRIWGVEFEGEKIGACGLKNIEDHRADYFGYIGIKSYWGRGIGIYMLKGVTDEALNLGITTLELKVREDNHRALACYLKFGFSPFVKDGTHLIMRKSI